MIRINLLPIRQAQKRQSIQQQLLIGAACIVVSIIALIVWTMSLSGTETELAMTKKKKSAEIQRLDKIIGQVNQFTEMKKELEQKLQVIEKLKKGKTGPVRALDDLSAEIPNRIWITEMTEKAGAVILEGRALDHEDVSVFMKALQKSKYFSGIELGFSKTKKTKDGLLYEFKITCAVNYAA